MNTTDCEKIECKLSKEFNFQGKFEANFEQLNIDENVSFIDKGLLFEEVSNATKSNVDTTFLTMINKQQRDEDLEKHQVLEKLSLLQKPNSCEEEIVKENNITTNTNTLSTTTANTTIDALANFTQNESILTLLTPPTPTTELIFTPSAIDGQEHDELQIAPASHLEVVAATAIHIANNGDNDDDSQADFDDTLQPLSERWSPLGANYDDAVTPSSELLSPESELELLSSDSQDKQEFHQHTDDVAEIARLKGLEEEQEMLTSSLMALTSHFAHVQLRVRQIVEAPANERDQLLRDLEEFAFQGIPEPASAPNTAADRSGSSSHNNQDSDAADQRQFELIDRLKSQLTELEKIAYESGAPVLPQHILLEKQKIIIDELKHKLNFKVDETKLPELTAEELKSQVDNAIGEFVGPLKMKEQLVAQLKTQITDLERFIAFLQCDTEESKMKTLNGSEKLSEAYNSYAAKKKQESKKLITDSSKLEAADVAVSSSNGNSSDVELKKNAEDSLRVRESLHSKAHGLMDKASLLMQMFATTHFGSKQEQFQKNTLKKTNKGNHWG